MATGTSLQKRLDGMDKVLLVTTLKEDILCNLHGINARITNFHESITLLDGSPTVLMTKVVLNTLFKIERTNFRTKHMKTMKQMQAENVWQLT